MPRHPHTHTMPVSCGTPPPPQALTENAELKVVVEKQNYRIKCVCRLPRGLNLA